MRINKYLALCGVASRRKVEEFVIAGQVKVNDKVVTDTSAQSGIAKYKWLWLKGNASIISSPSEFLTEYNKVADVNDLKGENMIFATNMSTIMVNSGNFTIGNVLYTLDGSSITDGTNSVTMHSYFYFNGVIYTVYYENGVVKSINPGGEGASLPVAPFVDAHGKTQYEFSLVEGGVPYRLVLGNNNVISYVINTYNEKKLDVTNKFTLQINGVSTTYQIVEASDGEQYINQISSSVGAQKQNDVKLLAPALRYEDYVLYILVSDNAGNEEVTYKVYEFDTTSSVLESACGIKSGACDHLLDNYSKVADVNATNGSFYINERPFIYDQSERKVYGYLTTMNTATNSFAISGRIYKVMALKF